MSTSFRLPRFGIKLFDALTMDSARPPYAYTRWSNPTVRALEDRLAALEGAEAGLAVATGMAAISALALTFLSSGDHLIASEVCYAGAVELSGLHLPRFGIEVSLVDTGDLDQVRAALRPNTRIVYAETPANPILRMADIGALAGIAHAAGALLAVDSTWAGPTLQRPLALGADYVIHSLTKYLNGHGDALGGAVLGPQAGIQRIRKEMLVHLGGALSPFNAWLISRGLVTLPERMERHCRNAAKVAQFLETHPKVIARGLPRPAQPSTPRAGAAADGGLRRDVDLSAQRRPGRRDHPGREDSCVPVRHVARPRPQPAFLLPHRHVRGRGPYLDSGQKARIREWMGGGIVRASVGLEDADDLIADLDQALRGRSFKGIVGPLAYRVLKARG